MPARTLLISLLPKGEVAIEAIEVRLGLLQERGEQGTLFETKGNSQARLALRRVLSHLESRYAGAMQMLRLRDEYTPLREERYSAIPALQLLPPLHEHASARRTICKR